MTCLIGAEELLKVEGSGRGLFSWEQRAALLEEFDRSGMSGAQFARLAGINYQTFRGWLHRRRRAAGSGVGERRGSATAGGVQVKLVEAVVGEGARCDSTKSVGCGNAGSGALRVELPGGCRLWLESPAHLAMAAELVVLVAQAGGARC